MLASGHPLFIGRLGGIAIIGVRPNRNRERGGGKINLFLTLLIVGALIFGAVKIVPVYVNNYQFQDAMQTEARFANTYPRKNEDDIRNDIWKEMQKQDINARKEDIHVTVQGDMVTITLDYTVPIDLKIFQWNKDFHVYADNHTI